MNKQYFADVIKFAFQTGVIDKETVLIRKGNDWNLAPSVPSLDTTAVYHSEAEAIEAFTDGLWTVFGKRSGLTAA